MSHEALSIKPVNQDNSANAVGEVARVEEPLKKDFYTEGQTRLPIQYKLSIGAVDDPLEHEADAMADHVMRMPDTSVIQRKCAHREDEEAQRKPLTPFIQRKETGNSNITSDATHNQIQSTRGGGNAMPVNTKTFMESRFGADFSGVRIHSGGYASQLSGELNAQAFTVGNDIYFNNGKFSPDSSDGKHLLAHELTHTIQQRNSLQRHIQRLGTPFGPAANGPSNWAAQVTTATTPTQKAALVRTAAGSTVTVNDATAASVSDAVPDPAHLRAFSIAAPVINFDGNLSSKNARAGGRPLTTNAGYTFQHGSSNYVVIGSSALDGTNYNQTLQTINHEFDHINQFLRNSTLTGNESELDAWISTFIREFHHSYRFSPTDTGTTCYVELAASFAPLLMYYQLVTNSSLRTSAVSRISVYYTATIHPNAGNNHAFNFWVFRSMGSAHNPALGTDVNTTLNLAINPASASSTYRGIQCSAVPASSLSGGSVITMPSIPPTAGG